jgi:hypothetical protein
VPREERVALARRKGEKNPSVIGNVNPWYIFLMKFKIEFLTSVEAEKLVKT